MHKRTAVKILCYHSIEELRPWAEELDALNRASRHKSPFSTFAFVENYCRHDTYYPGDRHAEPWILIAMERGEPIGCVALRRVVERIAGFEAAKLQFLMTHDIDCPVLVAKPEDEHRVSLEIYGYLLSRQDEWTLLEWSQQRPGSQLVPPPPELELTGHHLRFDRSLQTWRIAMRWPSLQQYYSAMTPGFRQNVRTQVKRLMAEGEVTLVSSADPTTTPLLFELAQIVAARSWKTSSWVSMLSHPDRLAYFSDLLSANQPLRAWLSVMMLDGFPIAAAIWGSYESTAYDLIDVFDGSLDRLSPGTTLRLFSMRWAIAQRFDAVDLMAGYGYYKARWLADEAPTMNGALVRKGSLHAIAARVRDFSDRLRAHATQPPRLDFNPSRRGAPRSFDVSVAQRGRALALTDRLRLLPAERLSHPQLVAALPFELRPRVRSPSMAQT